MVLRSKQESHRTQKPEISICSETAASGERTCLAANFPHRHSGILTRGIHPAIDEHAPGKIACAGPAIVTSSDADGQFRAFKNLHAYSCCGRSVRGVVVDTSRQRLTATTHADSR